MYWPFFLILSHFQDLWRISTLEFDFYVELYDRYPSLSPCHLVACATSAVYLNGGIGDWFRTTFGVRQRCSVTDSFQHLSGENYNWRTGRSQRNSQHRRQNNYQRTFCWWHWWPGRIKGGTSLPGGTPGPLAWKIMQRNPNWWLTTLEEVESFKYLGAVVTDQGSRPEVLSRITQTTAALARMKTIWNDNHISLSSKIRLMRSLVISVLLYACEIWTSTADILKKLQATEM